MCMNIYDAYVWILCDVYETDVDDARCDCNFSICYMMLNMCDTDWLVIMRLMHYDMYVPLNVMLMLK